MSLSYNCLVMNHCVYRRYTAYTLRESPWLFLPARLRAKQASRGALRLSAVSAGHPDITISRLLPGSKGSPLWPIISRSYTASFPVTRSPLPAQLDGGSPGVPMVPNNSCTHQSMCPGSGRSESVQGEYPISPETSGASHPCQSIGYDSILEPLGTVAAVVPRASRPYLHVGEQSRQHTITASIVASRPSHALIEFLHVDIQECSAVYFSSRRRLEGYLG